MGLMGGPGVWVAWGGLLCDASFFCCCARLRGRVDAWGRGVGGIRARKKGTIAFSSQAPHRRGFPLAATAHAWDD